MKTRFVMAFFISLAAAGCYYDNEDVLYKICQVDATGTRYSTTIKDILVSYGCLGCHGSVSPSGGVNLNAYAGVKTVANDGRLYGSVSGAPGYSLMPKGGAKMNDCDLKKVKAWVDAGAPDN